MRSTSMLVIELGLRAKNGRIIVECVQFLAAQKIRKLFENSSRYVIMYVMKFYAFSTAPRYRDHVSFHSFPKDVILRRTWQNKLRIDKKVSQNARVCSLHFSPKKYRS